MQVCDFLRRRLCGLIKWAKDTYFEDHGAATLYVSEIQEDFDFRSAQWLAMVHS